MYASTLAGGPGLLGDTVACVGHVAVGGDFTPSPDRTTAVVVPDDNPGHPVTVFGPMAAFVVSSMASAGALRAAFSGDLLSDGTLLSDGGAGKLSANEFYATQDRGACSATALQSYPAAGTGSTSASTVVDTLAVDTATTPPPTASGQFTGPLQATVNVAGGGLPENVEVYAADGRKYKLASASDASAAAALAAGPTGVLTITGTWDPATGLVAVSSFSAPSTNAYVAATTPENVVGGPAPASGAGGGGGGSGAPAGGGGTVTTVTRTISLGDLAAVASAIVAVLAFRSRR